MTWASKPLDTPASELVGLVRTGITVESIATPRAKLVLRQKRHWPGFINEPDLMEFDHVPVTEADEIVGVYDREGRTLMDLSEAMLMASDNSLLSFVERADRRTFVFLVNENQIVGIVTLADIQKLPVYCVLYSLLMSVEMLLMELIRKVCDTDPEIWMAHLDGHSKQRIEKYWRKAQKENVALDKLSCASFTDELTAGRGLKLFSANDSARLERLVELRDLVFHGKEIALTRNRALEIPAHVRDALHIQATLDNSLRKLTA